MLAEHTAVNRGVVGSSPTRGVKVNSLIQDTRPVGMMFTGFCVFHFSSEKPGAKYSAKINATVVINTSFNAG